MYLGIKAVVAKSFARIHRDNLINFGILPLVFKNPADLDKINESDRLVLENVLEGLKGGKDLKVRNDTSGTTFEVTYSFTPRQKEILFAGGLLNYTKAKH